MKKPIVFIAAIVAVVGLSAAVAVAKETTKVPTAVTIKFTGTVEGAGGGDGGVVDGTFSGGLRAKAGDLTLDPDQRQHAGECLKQRKVVLYQKPMRDLPARREGADRSNNRGRYRIEARGNAVWFWIEARKKIIIENDGEKVVCMKGRTKKALVTRIANDVQEPETRRSDGHRRPLPLTRN